MVCALDAGTAVDLVGDADARWRYIGDRRLLGSEGLSVTEACPSRPCVSCVGAGKAKVRFFDFDFRCAFAIEHCALSID